MMTLSAERVLVNFFSPRRACFFLVVQSALLCSWEKGVQIPCFHPRQKVGCCFVTGIKKGVSNIVNIFIKQVCSLLPWTFCANTVPARDPGEAMGTCIAVPAGFNWRDRRRHGPAMGLLATALLCCSEVSAHGGHGDSLSI